MYKTLEIIQEGNGKFVIKNGPRTVELSFENVSWLYDGEFYDIEEFDIEKANEYYNINDGITKKTHP